MKKSVALAVAVMLSGCMGGSGHLGQGIPAIHRPGLSDASVPQDWLTEKVCVDASDNPVSMDPYSSGDPFGNGCAGYTERAIRQGDPVPYYRYVVTGASPAQYTYAYSYPAASPSGEVLYLMVRAFAPQNRPPANWYVNPIFYPGHTHWDTYRIQGGWVSNAATRDNSGLNQIFFGNSGGAATPYNGWLDFPLAYLGAFGAASQTNVPVSDSYWEQSGLAWPLPPQNPPTSTSTQTTWTLLPNFTFDSGKVMNTLAAYHQSKPLPNSSNPDNGHMEIWYFTMPYGPTRWEVWSAATCLAGGSCAPKTTQYCAPAGPKTFPYGTASYTYYRTNCVDYSRTVTAVAGSSLPVIPVPETNALANFHFSNDPPGTANAPAGWTAGAVTLTQMQSHRSGDTRGGLYAGVRYVQLACAGTCSAASVLSQTLSASASGIYTFGADARSESANATLSVALQQIDSAGNVLDQTVVTKTITAIGDNSACKTLSSIAGCSTFVGERAPLTLASGTVAFRIAISPQTGGVTYDIVDAYLGRQ